MRPSTREPSVSYTFAESDLSSLPAMGCVVQASDAKPDAELLELPLVDSIFTLEDFACAPSRPLPRSSTSAQTSRGTAKGGRVERVAKYTRRKFLTPRRHCGLCPFLFGNLQLEMTMVLPTLI